MSDRVLVQIENHTALITVNDPERRNAVTAEISAALRAAVEPDPRITGIPSTKGAL